MVEWGIVGNYSFFIIIINYFVYIHDYMTDSIASWAHTCRLNFFSLSYTIFRHKVLDFKLFIMYIPA